MYKRIILKLSGEALAGETDNQLDDDTIKGIIEQVKEVVQNGIELSIVMGGGNFWRGRSSSESMDRTKSDQIGMLATIMNAIYLADRLAKLSIKAVVMTPFIVGNVTEQFSKEKAIKYLKEKKVLIFAGGIGHPFFSTDTITALRACELEADAILFAKTIDGVYDKDPAMHEDAKKFEQIECRLLIEKNLKVIDISAASLCYEQKIPVIIFDMSKKGNILKASIGEKIGTTVTV